MTGMTSVYGANQMQQYDVKSGKVDYTIKGNGNIMGMTQIKTVGKKRIVFDDYGAKSLEERVEVKKETTMGQAHTTKTHTIVYIDGDVLYSVDFNRKNITKTNNTGKALLAAMGNGKTAKEAGLAMMKSMGGKKVGTDKVLAYTCDVWELMGTRQCIYKGITLKLESNVMGLKQTEVATKADFDINIDADTFKLPDFPITDMTSGVPESATDMKRTEQSMKAAAALGAMMQGLTQGANSKTPTATQVKSAMQNAMLPMLKQQILSQEEPLKQLRSCLQHAQNRKVAQQCSDKIAQETGKPAQSITSWNAQTKVQILKEVDDALKAMACIKKAQNAQALDACMQ